MTIKINSLEIENVKRIKAVKIEPTAIGLTIVGGKNNQGKTSVLDSIAWALGGEKYEPSKPQRDGSTIPPNLKVVLSNGLIVERKGKNSTLKVTDPGGNKGSQQLLNYFVEQLAIDLPKFMQSTEKEKSQILLQIIGVGDQLAKLEREETEYYNDRLVMGRIYDQKNKYAKEQTHYDDVPAEPVSAKSLIDAQQEILARNGNNQLKRKKVEEYEYKVSTLNDEIARLTQQLKLKQEELNNVINDLTIAKTDALDLLDQSTEELESSIQNIDDINRKVRSNLDKVKAEEDANEYKVKCDELTNKIEKVRQDKIDLLKNADLPLPDLSVIDGKIIYKNQNWDNMSGSQQLKVATSIVRKLKPECGFVLLDKLEQMDLETMDEFGKWLEDEGIQAIATRVSTGEECSIIIEDGYVLNQEHEDTPILAYADTPALKEAKSNWKVGAF
ncbi:MAG: AAA family ATPase [Eubacterium sp.]